MTPKCAILCAAAKATTHLPAEIWFHFMVWIIIVKFLRQKSTTIFFLNKKREENWWLLGGFDTSAILSIREYCGSIDYRPEGHEVQKNCDHISEVDSYFMSVKSKKPVNSTRTTECIKGLFTSNWNRRPLNPAPKLTSHIFVETFFF